MHIKQPSSSRLAYNRVAQPGKGLGVLNRNDLGNLKAQALELAHEITLVAKSQLKTSSFSCVKGACGREHEPKATRNLRPEKKCHAYPLLLTDDVAKNSMPLAFAHNSATSLETWCLWAGRSHLVATKTAFMGLSRSSLRRVQGQGCLVQFYCFHDGRYSKGA